MIIIGCIAIFYVSMITLIAMFFNLSKIFKQYSSKLVIGSDVNFNDILAYKEQKLYVNGEETKDVAVLALKIQQHIGTLKQDKKIINTINDL